MIVTGTNTTVNFFVADSDGLPATGKDSSITATISMNGDSATAITDTIYEIDSTNQPGWYRFNHTFGVAGNAFIAFACTNCLITPWEDEIVDLPIAGLKTSMDKLNAGILNWSVSGNTLTLYNADSTQLAQCTITRDSSGNIIQIEPTN